ncbi:MAG: hypothetical protein V3T08_07610 [Gemmatimonadota bacterium]
MLAEERAAAAGGRAAGAFRAGSISARANRPAKSDLQDGVRRFPAVIVVLAAIAAFKLKRDR